MVNSKKFNNIFDKDNKYMPFLIKSSDKILTNIFLPKNHQINQ